MDILVASIIPVPQLHTYILRSPDIVYNNDVIKVSYTVVDVLYIVVISFIY